MYSKKYLAYSCLKGNYFLLIILVFSLVYLPACSSSSKNDSNSNNPSFTPTYEYMFSGNNNEWLAQLTESGDDSQYNRSLFVVFKGNLSDLPTDEKFTYTLSYSSGKVKLLGGGKLPNRISRYESYSLKKVAPGYKKTDLLKLEINYHEKSELLELKNVLD